MLERTAGLAALALTASSVAYAQSEEPRGIDSPAPQEPQKDKNNDTKDADSTAVVPGEVVVIEAEAPYVPVASRSVRDRDFLLRPRPRPADILRVVPGLFVTQHAGGGKANQYFLRGFDADHGTDIALSVDGVPVNMVSHGHGQGYADLNWVIPEIVQTIDVFKGPYAADQGDFATAGAVDMVTHEQIDRSSIAVSGGRFDTYRLLGIAAPVAANDWTSLFAAEAYFTNGPFLSGEKYHRYNAFARVVRAAGSRSTVAFTATSYSGGWNASGQIPEREVDAGNLDRFGSLDPTDGGNSARHSAYVTYRAYPDDASEFTLLAYAVRYRFALYSNFTFWLVDPVLGDQIEQTDDRTMTGLAAKYRVRHDVGPVRLHTTVGTAVRADAVDNALYHTAGRERLDTRVDAHVDERSIGLYGQADVAWTRWLRTVVGARVDHFGFQVDDHLEDRTTTGTVGSGVRDRVIVSPKATVVITPTRGTDVYANFGMGFHSNDARAVVRRPGRGTPLARATGYELGARSRLLDRFDLAGSAWLLDLDSETVWVGDEGGTEARGPTRRYGVDVEARAEIAPWLVADVDVTYARGRFRDLPAGEDQIPLAPRFTMTAGLSALHPRGFFGRVGARGLSARPLTEDGFLQADGFTLVDVTAGYRTDRYEISVAVDNVLDAEWREAQFATTSRVAGDPPTDRPPPAGACPDGSRVSTDDDGNFAGCEGVHFTPGAPINVMATLRLFY